MITPTIHLRWLTCGLAMLATAACSTLRTQYTAPGVEIASSWRYADSSAGTNRDATGAWWQDFGDAGLERFVQSVLDHNNDLAAAVASARQARLQADLNSAQLGPRISAGIGASRTTESGSSTGYSASAAVSYELDLWGALQASRDAAHWQADASEQDREATRLSLTGSAVTLYWQLAYLNLEVAATEDSVAYAERTSALVQAQYKAGGVSALETSEAEQNLRSQRSVLSQLTQLRVETRNAIAVLRNGEPWPEADEPQMLPAVLPVVDAGIPSTILAQRPDLRAAELRLRATLASGDATRLGYYPGITLTASGGATSTALKDLLSDPVGTLAASLALPFLQANEVSLSTRISAAEYEAAAYGFRQTLQTALFEVEDALSARTQLAVQGENLTAALAAAQTVERLYEARYRAGGAALRDWLDAQESRRQATLAQQANQLKRLTNHTTLLLALGGDTAA